MGIWYSYAMKLLSVVPIIKGVAPEVLSYFSSAEVAPGALVMVPVRKKSVPALVVSVRDASTSKADIKTASFSLKKIDKVVAERVFSASLMHAVVHIADVHVASIGATLAALIPLPVIENITSLASHDVRVIDSRDTPPLIVQAAFRERIARYKALIRESFAQGKSIVVIGPTAAEVDMLARELSGGIENRVVVVSSALTPKRLVMAWKTAIAEAQPVCVVGTHHAALIDRADIGTIVMEHESSPYYKQQSRPFLDARVALTHCAKIRGIRCVLGDCFMRVETLARIVEDDSDGIRSTFRQDTIHPLEFVDMKTLPDEYKRNALAPVSLDALRGSVAMNERSFVYTLRKGHSSFTVCRDCGLVLLCDRCDAPMVLHLNRPQDADGISEGRSFSCHRCGRSRDTHTVCEGCGSWRLEMYGSGVEKVTEEIRKVLPGVPVFQLSADTASTPAQSKAVADAWRESSNGILVGTDMALAHIRGITIGTAVLASVDTLLALPDMGMQERVFRLVCELRDMAQRAFVQTRDIEAAAFGAARSGNGWELYQRELAHRKALQYPPFTTLIKITRSGDKTVVMNDLQTVKTLCEPYQTLIYPAFVSKIKNQHIAHALVIVPRESWPDARLIEALRALPPSFAINVAPESLL